MYLDPKQLSGFTLFEGSKGWQQSYRLKGENGWIVRIINRSEAEELLQKITELSVTFSIPKLEPVDSEATIKEIVRSRRRIMLDDEIEEL